MNQFLTALRFYATRTHQLVIGDTFSVIKATICRVVHKVTAAIVSLCSIHNDTINIAFAPDKKRVYSEKLNRKINQRNQ